MERADLVLVAGLLERLRAPVAGEVAAARVAWPAFAHGLPTALTTAQARALGTLTSGPPAATTPALPWYVTTREGGGLTGPAAAVGGLLNGYATLAPRGWRFLAAALAAERRGQAPGSSSQARAAARFMRANAGLYVYSVYDGHYDLSLVGRTLYDGYLKLGGAGAFGSTLTPARVEAVARAYSIPAGRLQPHPPNGLPV